MSTHLGPSSEQASQAINFVRPSTRPTIAAAPSAPAGLLRRTLSYKNYSRLGAVVAAVFSLVAAACSSGGASGSNAGGGGGSSSSVSMQAPAPPASSAPAESTGRGEGAVYNGNTTGGTDLTAATNYLTAVVDDVNKVWTDWFASANLTGPMVAYDIVQPNEPKQSNCSLDGSYMWTSTTQNAMFCPTDYPTINGTAYDGEIWLPVQTFASMWDGNIFGRQANTDVGDFAAAAMVAHEYGHKVQEQLSLDYNVAPPTNPNRELIADCFAGVWAYVAWTRAEVSTYDLNVAIHALSVIGDGDGSHGTDAQRVDAFLTGMNGTSDNPQHAYPSICTQKYWSALPM